MYIIHVSVAHVWMLDHEHVVVILGTMPCIMSYVSAGRCVEPAVYLPSVQQVVSM